MNFAVQEYGWSIGQTLDAPVIIIMLLMRLKISIDKGQCLSLMDQEKLDRIGDDKKSWEQLVRENRKQFMRNMQ